jgi:hypothetical protein
MFKRVTWWIVGAVMGGAGSTWAQRRVKKVVRSKVGAVSPAAVVDVARGKVSSAVREGREAAKAKERDLKSRISGRP